VPRAGALLQIIPFSASLRNLQTARRNLDAFPCGASGHHSLEAKSGLQQSLDFAVVALIPLFRYYVCGDAEIECFGGVS